MVEEIDITEGGREDDSDGGGIPDPVEDGVEEAEAEAEGPNFKEAKAEREKMEAATAAAKKENDRAEEIEQRRILSGKTRAGGAPPKPETEDEKWAREAKERYAGTGLDPTPDDGTPTVYA